MTFGHVKIAQGIPPALGTSGGFGWRVTAHAALNGISVPIYLDVLGFIYGTAEVRLQSTGLVAPFPGSAQEHLYRDAHRAREVAEAVGASPCPMRASPAASASG